MFWSRRRPWTLCHHAHWLFFGLVIFRYFSFLFCTFHAKILSKSESVTHRIHTRACPLIIPELHVSKHCRIYRYEEWEKLYVKYHRSQHHEIRAALCLVITRKFSLHLFEINYDYARKPRGTQTPCFTFLHVKIQRQCRFSFHSHWHSFWKDCRQ